MNLTEDFNYTISNEEFSMNFTKLRNNGTVLVTFSEDMMDEDSGLNITILDKEDLIKFNISLT